MKRRRALTYCPFRLIAFPAMAACLALAALPTHGDTRRTMRLTVYRPARIAGRNAAGRPFISAINHGAATLDHVSAPLGWLGPAGFIRGLIPW